MASGQFNTVSTVNDDNAGDINFAGFDRVLYFSNASNLQDPTAIGNKLANFTDTGNRLVLAAFAFANQGSNTLGGKIKTGIQSLPGEWLEPLLERYHGIQR